MEDNASRNISKSVTDLANKEYGLNYFIIDSTAPSPEGLIFYGGYAITDITGLSIDNSTAHADSSDFPATLSMNAQLPGGISGISVETGTIICFYG